MVSASAPTPGTCESPPACLPPPRYSLPRAQDDRFTETQHHITQTSTASIEALRLNSQNNARHHDQVLQALQAGMKHTGDTVQQGVRTRRSMTRSAGKASHCT